MRTSNRLVILIVALLAVLGTSGSKRHEFYVSITELDCRNDTLQIAIKIFTDDFEYVLKERSQQKIFLQPGADQEKILRHIRDYSSDQFQVSSAVKTFPVEWIGHEFIEDVCWVYGYALPDRDSKVLFVRNHMLIDQFPDQHNMIHLRCGDGQESKVCTSSIPEVRFLLP